MDQSDTPDLADVLQTWFQAFARDLSTAFPGQVQSYDASSQTADVRPMTQRWIDTEDGGITPDPLPMLPGIPVLFPRSGPWFLTLPVSPGDWVLVICCEASIGHLRSTGQLMDPGDLRRHHPAHAVCIPGFFPSSQALSDASGSALLLGKSSGPQLGVDGSAVHVGAYPSADFVALAAKVDAAISSIRTIFASHTHTGVTTGIGTSGIPVLPIPDPGSVAATKAKAT